MDDNLRGRYRRDFSNEINRPPQPSHRPQPTDLRRPPQPEPVRHHQTPAESLPQPVQHPAHHTNSTHGRRQKRRRRYIIAIILLLLIGGAAAGGYEYWSIKLKSPVPSTILASVNYPILYPAELPPGFSLDKNSFKTSGNAVLYTASNAAGTKISFTVQQRPASFNFSQFYAKGLTNSTVFNTPIGQAAIGTSNSLLIGSMATSKSWSLESSPSKSVTAGDLRLILDNMKQTQ